MKPKSLSVLEFLSRITSSARKQPASLDRRPSDIEGFRTVEDLIRKELGKVARDVRAVSLSV